MPARAFFVGRAKYNMKKFIIFAVITGSMAYYACLPLMVVQADMTSITTGTSAGTTIPQIPAPIAESTDTIVSTLSMRVTAYASVPDETDSTPFTTADGTHVATGIVASNILPFGTRIKIPALFGDEIFTVHDRMSPRIKNTIDIWMPSVKQALYFGAEHANIVVLGQTTTSTQNLAILN